MVGSQEGTPCGGRPWAGLIGGGPGEEGRDEGPGGGSPGEGRRRVRFEEKSGRREVGTEAGDPLRGKSGRVS